MRVAAVRNASRIPALCDTEARMKSSGIWRRAASPRRRGSTPRGGPVDGDRPADLDGPAVERDLDERGGRHSAITLPSAWMR